MKTLFKATGVAGVILAMLFGFYGLYKMSMGNYFHNAGLVSTAVIAFISILLLILGFWMIRKISLLALVFLPLIFVGCNYAKSNQQVLVSEDCGMNWKKINAGEAIPKEGMNRCYMKVVIPNFPMQGDSKFLGNFKDRVKVEVHIDYDYSIIDPLSFITQAKYLGKANQDADSDEALNPAAFETAENAVIDKRIKEIAKDIFNEEDIIEINNDELERRLTEGVNKMLDPLGVQLNFITITLLPDDQTQLAIDVATAMKIYESKNLSELGKDVISKRAGAPRIIVENKLEAQTQKE